MTSLYFFFLQLAIVVATNTCSQDDRKVRNDNIDLLESGPNILTILIISMCTGGPRTFVHVLLHFNLCNSTTEYYSKKNRIFKDISEILLAVYKFTKK